MDGIPPSASFDSNFGLNDEPIPNSELDASADWLMWQLFNSQIPADYLDTILPFKTLKYAPNTPRKFQPSHTSD
ncbi:hypothetical protein RIB2604_01505690 [Aspergillus luchuensis]|uniref:Uncharacterized protein n=1 Tax=Aspergillus kawachii TaxID=1069201 RepID=A0A146FAG2_ASPKA|nr:hypothetical protein RIB2604_01505690 [Aspergillus luchuensis]